MSLNLTFYNCNIAHLFEMIYLEITKNYCAMHNCSILAKIMK